MSRCGVFSGPYFTVFGLNTKIYCVNLPVQSKYRKIWTRKNSVFGQFSRSDEIGGSVLLVHKQHLKLFFCISTPSEEGFSRPNDETIALKQAYHSLSPFNQTNMKMYIT